MSHEPKIQGKNPGYYWILDNLLTSEPFYFLKLNHGFWERLARIENLGYSLDELRFLNQKQIEELERAIGAYKSYFVGDGFLDEFLNLLMMQKAASKSLFFVSSLQPWPMSDRIEGTPYERKSQCEALIKKYVSKSIIARSHSLSFTGYEFKQAIIDGQISQFFKAINQRKVLILCNERNREIFDHVKLENVEFIVIDEHSARQNRQTLLIEVEQKISLAKEENLVVLTMIGGALATWLGLKLHKLKAKCQYIDVGAAFYAFVQGEAGKRGWMKVYSKQLSSTIQGINLPDKITNRYQTDKNAMAYTSHDEDAKEYGAHTFVAQGLKGEDLQACKEQPGFIENKLYDFERLKGYLDLSTRANHHANGGPVVKLLEESVKKVLNLPATRHVVAVNSGTSALYLAAAVNQIKSRKQYFKWLTSEFSFFSSGCGMLGNPVVAPCDHQGRLDLKALEKIPLNEYDGIVFTNIFSQHSDWGSLFSWCKTNKKKMIVDNATGLLDRPILDNLDEAPIEIISCHRTKPWGVGEGGVLICSEEEAIIARKLANFGVGLSYTDTSFAKLGANYKLSDLSAAAILCRLESVDSWKVFYEMQERRVKSLVIDSELPLVPLSGQSQPRSPRGFTPFISKVPVSIVDNGGIILCRKYYKPIVTIEKHSYGDARANDLYQRIVCISNNPFNRNVSNVEFINMLNSSLIFHQV